VAAGGAIEILRQDRRVRAILAAWALLAVVCATLAVLKPRSHSVYPIYQFAMDAWSNREAAYVLVPGFDYWRYSPSCLAAVSTLRPLGEAWGGAVWRLIGIVALVYALARWCRFARGYADGRSVAWVFLLVTPFLLQNLHNGQINVHLLASLLMAGAFVGERRWWPAAFAFAVAIAIKPYVVAVAALVSLAAPAVSWRTAVATLAVLAASFLTNDPLYVWEQHVAWIRHFSGNDRSVLPLRAHYRDLAIVARTYFAPLPHAAYLAGITAVGLALAAIVAVRRPGPRLAFDLGACWITAFGPATESCTYLLLAPTLAAGLVDRPGRDGFGLRISYSLFVGTICASLFPNDWQVQVMGPQPIAGVIATLAFVRSAWATPGATETRSWRMAA
jgi:hypothetical protein